MTSIWQFVGWRIPSGKRRDSRNVTVSISGWRLKEYNVAGINQAVALEIAHSAELTVVSVIDPARVTPFMAMPIGDGPIAYAETGSFWSKHVKESSGQLANLRKLARLQVSDIESFGKSVNHFH